MPTPTWTVDLFCSSCRSVVPCQVPGGLGVVEFLESRPECPKCGVRTIWLNERMEKPVEIQAGAPEGPIPPESTILP